MKSTTGGFSTAAVAVIACMALIGCGSDDAVAPSVLLPTVSEDISETVSSVLAADNGGVVDQLGDLSDLAQETFALMPSIKPLEGAAVPVYDSVNGVWTVQINRERGYPNGQRYARYSRTYTYQYRNQNGEPQKEWLIGQDTARSIHFTVVEGNGYCRTERLGGLQTQVAAQWIVTSAHADTLTISGTCRRAGIDTLKSNQAVRTLQYQLTMQFSNLRCLRGAGADAAGQVRGDLAAVFSAAVTFMSGQAYGETDFERTMSIQMAQGEANISINGQSYSGDLATGRLGS
jgi:hypothetical protein